MPIVNYGLKLSESANQLHAELTAFALKRRPDQGGLGTYRHFQNAASILYPKMAWHSWMKDRVQGLCDYPVNSWVGCAASGKTHDAAFYAMIFFLADPMHTSVILTSTTHKMVRKRIWPVIQELYHGCPGFPGNLVDSKTTLQAVKGDDKHGIFAIAVREGSTSKAVADIQGLHNERILLIIDEATDTPEAVFEAVANLSKGCIDFQILCIGNPVSYLDAHGKMCTPVGGWSSVTVDDEDWETLGVPKWGIRPGICLHFDGIKSPNIKAGVNKFPFLITKEDVDNARKAEQGEESLGFWKYTRGFWAPEGTCKRIFSEPLVLKHDGMGDHVFLSHKIKIGGLDPGFGGDSCILRFADYGDIEGGKMGIQLGRSVDIKVNVKSKEPIHYQIKKRVIDECRAEGCLPQHFGMDVTTEAGGLADIIATEWSSKLHRVEFGGAPSDKPVSDQDFRTAKEVYDRKVTELYYICRQFLMSGQLKGLKDKEITQFCSREYTDEKRKIKLDTKGECKKKIGRSPDDADAVVVVVEVARRLGAIPGVAPETGSDDDWLAHSVKSCDIFEEIMTSESIMTPAVSYALEDI